MSVISPFIVLTIAYACRGAGATAPLVAGLAYLGLMDIVENDKAGTEEESADFHIHNTGLIMLFTVFEDLPQFAAQTIITIESKQKATFITYFSPASSFVSGIVLRSNIYIASAAYYKYTCSSDDSRRNCISCASFFVPILEFAVLGSVMAIAVSNM